MATFECKVHELEIEPHPNADLLELAKVGDYRAVVGKGQFKTGDLGVYIPEAAILSETLIERMGLVGKLTGSKHNRVKAVKLRGVLSQGLVVRLEYRKNVFNKDTAEWSNVWVYPISDCGAGYVVTEGEDLTEMLGITKYEPAVPTCMQGEVFNAFGKTLKYDVENIKRYPDVLVEGEEISITEKLHGTWCCMGKHPDVDIPVVTSKGLSGRGLAFKMNEVNKSNLYVKTLLSTMDDDFKTIVEQAIAAYDWSAFYILGEIFGAGVQDLAYGGKQPRFRIFDIYLGEPEHGRYMNSDEVKQVAKELGVETVPILYEGKYSPEIVEQLTNGKETVSGTEAHMREGVVIRTKEERTDSVIGRVMLKSVSEAYILRKGNKGVTVTEYA